MKNIDSQSFEQDVLQSDTPVIVDFWASWCNPCKAFAPVFDKVSSEVSDITFAKVQVDSGDNETLARDYGVRTIPRVMGFKNGAVFILEDKLSAETLRKFAEHVRTS